VLSQPDRALVSLVTSVAFCVAPSRLCRADEMPYPDPPQVLFSELFVEIQQAPVYADGKLFADAIPRIAPATIRAQFRLERPSTTADLKAFAEAHFVLPSAADEAANETAHVPIGPHIDGLWQRLTRATPTVPPFSSQLPLPYRYVVPGGRFRELYYWDSYFSMLGLAESGRHDLLEDMVRDFAYLIDSYGHVPNGTRSYYLSRSQPPFFFEMVGLLSADDPAESYERYLPQLRREYAYWMDGAERLVRGHAHRHAVALPDGSVLNRYWDDRATPRDESYRNDVMLARASGRNAPQVFRDIRAAAESGWDFSSRWFADGRTLATIDTTEIVPIDLNSLLYGLENAIRSGCDRAGDGGCARDFARRSETRRAAVDRYLWDAQAGAYLDYRWTRRARVPRLSAATLYPLFVQMASAAQARAVAQTTGASLVKDGGMVTTAVDTGAQWDAPNGWAPLQWIAVSGLSRYGERSLAESIACRWMLAVNSVYGQRGALVEKYDVIHTTRQGGGGEYPLQDGFGWTNGVMRKLMALYPNDATVSELERCPAPIDRGVRPPQREPMPTAAERGPD
jgi:alpha,alpha-trehalase